MNLQNLTDHTKVMHYNTNYAIHFLTNQKIKNLSKLLKVAFSQKGLRRLSFLQTDEPNYFPELEF